MAKVSFAGSTGPYGCDGDAIGGGIGRRGAGRRPPFPPNVGEIDVRTLILLRGRDPSAILLYVVKLRITTDDDPLNETFRPRIVR